MAEKVDVGKTVEDIKESKDKKVFPTLFLSTKEVPKLKGKDVGDTGTLAADYKIVGKRIDNEDKEERFDIDILKIALAAKSAVEEDENEKEQGKVRVRLQRGKKS